MISVILSMIKSVVFWYHVQSQSLEEMFKKVMGPRSSQIYSFSVFFLLIGCLSIYIIFMGMQFNDVYKMYREMMGDEKDKIQKFNFRILSIAFSVLCGLSLFIRNLKMLSYVSMIKIVVIILVLFLSVAYAPTEYTRRREENPLSGKTRTFREEFPLWPTVLGFMRAMGSWQTAYLFHMGVSEMYFSLQNRSYAKWSKVSRVSVLIIATLNVCYALAGYLATADQLHPQKDAVDMCSNSDIFLSLYDTNYDKEPLKWVLLFGGRAVIVLILMASYPLIMFFLKEYTVSIVQNLAPKAIESRSKASVNTTANIALWLTITVCSCITGDPFTITNLVVSVVGTIVVFLMPALCWMQIHGGFAYVFSLGLCREMKGQNEAPTMTQGVRVPSRSVTPTVTHKEQEQEFQVDEANDKASVLGMLVAQSIVYMSIAFMIIGVFMTLAEMIKGKAAPWRASVGEYFQL